jgi:hypothetical protein
MTTVYRSMRRLGVGVAIAAGVLSLSGAVRAGGNEISGVRSSSAAIRELIDDGMWESPTFRRLVQAIRATDGIVYVEEGVCRHGVHACLLLSVTSTPEYRILRILVDREGVLAHRHRFDLIATIGHELWHALEVLAERTLRTTAAIFLYYDRQAPTDNEHTFETREAVATASRIRHELGNHTTIVVEQVALDFAR